MTVTRPLSGGDPSWEDTEALRVLDSNYASRLEIVQARSEKWMGGLTALTGLLGTVLILKGPDAAADLPLASRIAVACLIAAALGALAFATFRAYQSAYGDPGRLETIDRSIVTGLAQRLNAARITAAQQAQERLRQAVVATFVGVAALAAATAVTWFPPTAEISKTASTCITVGQKVLAELPGSTVTLTATNDGVTIGPCR